MTASPSTSSPAAEVTISYDPATGEEFWKVRHESFGWNSACRAVYDLDRIDNGK
jgi:hypothetical protein